MVDTLKGIPQLVHAVRCAIPLYDVVRVMVAPFQLALCYPVFRNDGIGEGTITVNHHAVRQILPLPVKRAADKLYAQPFFDILKFLPSTWRH